MKRHWRSLTNLAENSERPPAWDHIVLRQQLEPVDAKVASTVVRVAVAALELGDNEGYEAITMRAVGKALGVEAMSLYNHVANKEDLLDAVGDLLYSELMERHSCGQVISHSVTNRGWWLVRILAGTIPKAFLRSPTSGLLCPELPHKSQ